MSGYMIIPIAFALAYVVLGFISEIDHPWAKPASWSTGTMSLITFVIIAFIDVR